MSAGGGRVSGATRAATADHAAPGHAVPSPTSGASLRLSEPSDPLEREADRMADRVMRLTAGTVMRACSCSDEEVKRKADGPSGARRQVASGPVSRSEVTPLGAGSPLGAGVKSWADSAFGADMAAVRVHTASAAADIAASINARAYTIGTDIVFGRDQYRPDSASGRRLLAHELTHVVQGSNFAQRTVHRANLTSPRMAGNQLFEDVLDNKEVIEFGESGDEVRRVQQMLMDLGFSIPTKGTSGTFDAETRAAVKAFQTSVGLNSDGRVGFRTIGALDKKFPTVALPVKRTDPWSMSCVLQILCPWNRHLVENVLPSFTIKTFDSRTFPTETWDGSKWVKGTFRSGGFRSSSTKTIGLLNTTNCQTFAFTAYHEGWHAMQGSGLGSVEAVEVDAYHSTEQWSIDIGVPGQTFRDKATGSQRDLRKADPDEGEVVDPAAAIDLVRQKYGGVSSVPGETVLARVGASDVRVRRPNGTIAVRAAVVGDRVRGPTTMTNLKTMNAALWKCP